MKLIIIGAGGFGREILSFVKSKVDVVGFIDNNVLLKGKCINGIPVLGGDSLLPYIREQGIESAFVAIGDYKIRARMFDQIKSLGFKPLNIIHPSAVIADNVEIGEGVVVYPNVTINTNVKIGNAVLINSGATIGHDTVIENFVTINPGANLAGKVVIERGAFIGIGVSVIEEVTIGTQSIIGAGAVVIRDIPPKVVAFGVPAKVIKNIE